MTGNLKIIRLKRYTSREDRLKHPDWRNPDHLSPTELEALASLDNSSVAGLSKRLNAMEKGGGEMLLAYRGEDKIVGAMVYTFVPTLQGMLCLVTQTMLKNGGPPETWDVLREALKRIANEHDITSIQTLTLDQPSNTHRPSGVRRSGISAIKQAERMDEQLGEAVEDGPPTRKLAGSKSSH